VALRIVIIIVVVVVFVVSGVVVVVGSGSIGVVIAASHRQLIRTYPSLHRGSYSCIVIINGHTNNHINTSATS
jgi:hypothetical protein